MIYLIRVDHDNHVDIERERERIAQNLGKADHQVMSESDALVLMQWIDDIYSEETGEDLDTGITIHLTTDEQHWLNNLLGVANEVLHKIPGDHTQDILDKVQV